MAAFALRLLAVECQYAGAFLPVSSEAPERQLSGIGLAAGYDWDGEGFRALQRTKASHAGTRVGSGTELWGFVLWPGRETAVRSGKTTEAAARHTTPTIIIEVRNVDLSSFSGLVAMR